MDDANINIWYKPDEAISYDFSGNLLEGIPVEYNKRWSATSGSCIDSNGILVLKVPMSVALGKQFKLTGFNSSMTSVDGQPSTFYVQPDETSAGASILAMKSLWSKTVQLPEREMLKADLRVKNVVIGAGLAGILIAYFLQEKGQEVIVLDAKEVASGQTKNTTAKITSQHGLIYHDLIKKTGIERATGYARANEKAIQLYNEIITKEGIACHFEKHPSFLYSQKEDGVEKLKKEAKAAKSLGIEAEYVRGDKVEELPFGVMGAVFVDKSQYQTDDQ